MIARGPAGIVLVAGAIPGERVRARIERVSKAVTFARVEEVLVASADRRPVGFDPRCGGSSLAHVAYPAQLDLKGAVIEDAFRRVARAPLGARPTVIGSPEGGYRMRARLHVAGGRVGFLLDGTHEVCDATLTRQLLPATGAWVAAAAIMVEREGWRDLRSIEISETRDGAMRACHLEVRRGPSHVYEGLAEGTTGLSVSTDDRPGSRILSGSPYVVETLRVDVPPATLPLRRHVRAFFQGNRFLLDAIVEEVVRRVDVTAPVLDLYAGVGLFGLSLAARGAAAVTLVEGDAASGADLQANAAPCGDRVRVLRASVEAYLTSAARHDPRPATVIVDPPRTGLSKPALAGVLGLRPSRIVYASCDPATLARDARALLDAGYGMQDVTGLDLFPGTAHVETIVAFTSGAGRRSPSDPACG